MPHTFLSIPVVIQSLRRKSLWIALAVLSVLGLYPIICELIVMSSLPRALTGWVSILWEIIAGLLLLAELAGLLLSPFFLLFSKTRRSATLVFGVCLCALLMFIPGLFVSRLIRMQGFESLAMRTKPLISAIEKYQDVQGQAPEKLTDLVPEFLSSVPETGISAYPHYEYERFKEGKDPWQLRVSCSVGLLNWDEFFYLPSKKYEHRYGGWIEPVGDWAYFHE